MESEETKSLAKKQFGREASKYVVSQVHSSQSDLEFVHQFIHPQADWDMLDIATGAGHLALLLAPDIQSVIATDITPEMLEEAKKLASDRGIDNLTTAEVDVHQIPYDDESFHLVTSRIAPHHFYDVRQAIAEMARVCRTGGYLFIQDTVAPEDPEAARLFNKIEKLRDPSHVRDLSPTQWMDLLEENGFTIERHFTKPKDWPLNWWTERMSTPQQNVIEIIRILENIYDDYRDQIHIRKAEEYESLDPEDPPGNLDDVIPLWSMHPHNGYFLAKKLN